jgi:serine/threonine-protein kinase
MTLGGKYVLEKPVGFGGMAEVWAATNKATSAKVCVKVLASDDAEAVERFRREAHAGARLTHRAIVRVFDLLLLDARGQVSREGEPRAYAMVMELLRGESLGDHLAKRGRLPLAEALDVLLPVISALAHAHRANVVHRDLKPDNIFLAVDPDGHVGPKVLDFGVSKIGGASAITGDGALVGTPSFMSPEQARGARQVDARSDVFSAAVLFYLMLTGTNPFEQASFAASVEAVLRREAPRIGELPVELWEVVERALAKDPAARYADATEMGIALRKAAGRRSTTDSAPSVPAARSSLPSLDSIPSTIRSDLPAVVPPSRTRRWGGIAAGAAGATLAVAILAGLVGRRGEQPRVLSARSASVPSAAASSSPSVVPPPPSSPPVLASAAPSASAPPIPTAVSPRSAESGRRPEGGFSARPAPSTTPAPTRRKPNEEPHNARDPGF